MYNTFHKLGIFLNGFYTTIITLFLQKWGIFKGCELCTIEENNDVKKYSKSNMSPKKRDDNV